MKRIKEIKNIIYIAGVVLDKTDLLAYVSDEYPNIYCHHMTIKYGGISELPPNLGETFNFIGESIAYDEKAIAITGYPDNKELEDYMISINQQPHITICTAEGIKPVYSKELIKKGIYNPINLTIPMKIGAFVAYTDNTTGWIYC